jgi:hypothetical protein
MSGDRGLEFLWSIAAATETFSRGRRLWRGESTLSEDF